MKMLLLMRSLTYSFVSTSNCARYYSQTINLDQAIRNVFSEEGKRTMIQHTEILEKEDDTGSRFLLKNVKKKAAVLVPLCTVDDEPVMLLTVRTNLLPTHKGQVSFPGGGMNQKKDKSIYDTALRETEEEIGFPRNKIDVWGSLSPIPDRPDQNMISSVYPVVGYLGEVKLKDLKPCENEVSKIFSIPFKQFFDPSFCKMTQFRIIKTTNRKFNYTMPVFMSEPKVWGLTAVVIDQVLSVLMHGQYKKIGRISLGKSDEYLDRIQHHHSGTVDS